MKRQTILVLAVSGFFLMSTLVSVDVRADLFFDNFDDGDTDGWWLC